MLYEVQVFTTWGMVECKVFKSYEKAQAYMCRKLDNPMYDAYIIEKEV